MQREGREHLTHCVFLFTWNSRRTETIGNEIRAIFGLGWDKSTDRLLAGMGEDAELRELL